MLDVEKEVKQLYKEKKIDDKDYLNNMILIKLIEAIKNKRWRL